jgi:inositol transport system ATP-binding protein
VTIQTTEDGALLEVRRLVKTFPGVRALDGVHLDVRGGEVHCLVGENGAGKSTLLRILAGLDQPDHGEIRFGGEACRFKSPRDAIARGIAMIHQELTPFPELTVAENIFMGREPAGRLPGTIDWRRMRSDAGTLLESLGAAVSPSSRMRELSVSETQMVEIAKAVARGASLIVMDEPTSALSHHEAEALFRLIGDLRRGGAAVVYVSHKLDEIFRLGDRATVLRDGRYISTDRIADLDEATLVTRMVGRPVEAGRGGLPSPAGEVALEVRDLGRAGGFADISFQLRRGEVLGLAGLMGAGRTEVVGAIYGLNPADRGTISIRGRAVRIASPRDALREGIGFVSEDRKQVGLVLNQSVKHNLTLSHLGLCCRRGLIQGPMENAAADDAIRRYGIKVSGRDQLVGQLSGGNQQKVVMAKVRFGDPSILLLDEPTRGIDIGAKQEIYALIAGWAREGRAVLLVSSELPELLALSDRILVMRAGRIAAELRGGEISQEAILRHAMPN